MTGKELVDGLIAYHRLQYDEEWDLVDVGDQDLGRTRFHRRTIVAIERIKLFTPDRRARRALATSYLRGAYGFFYSIWLDRLGL